MLLSLFFSFCFFFRLFRFPWVKKQHLRLKIADCFKYPVHSTVRSTLHSIFPERQEDRLMIATHARLLKTSINTLSQKTWNVIFPETQEADSREPTMIVWKNKFLRKHAFPENRKPLALSSRKTRNVCTLASVETIASICRQDRPVTKFVRGVFAGDQMPLNHQTDHFISFRFNEMHEVLK